MARTKGARGSKTPFPSRLQDRSPIERELAEGLAAAVTATSTAAAEETVAEARVDAGQLAMHTAEVTLRAGGRGGRTTVEGTFTAAQIGRPVMVTQAAPTRISDAEGGLVLFVGEIVSSRQMRIAWFSSAPAPARAKINYIVG